MNDVNLSKQKCLCRRKKAKQGSIVKGKENNNVSKTSNFSIVFASDC